MATDDRREFNHSLVKLRLHFMPCRAGFRSEPRYVISEDATLTKGIGAVTSLAGIVVFSESVLMASGGIVHLWVYGFVCMALLGNLLDIAGRLLLFQSIPAEVLGKLFMLGCLLPLAVLATSDIENNSNCTWPIHHLLCRHWVPVVPSVE